MSVTQLLVQRLEQKNRLEIAQWKTEDRAERATLREQAKSYAALPQHGWREDKSKKWESLPNHPDYRAALRLVRDAIVEEAPMQYEDTVAELFRDLSLGYNEIGLEILNEWVDSGDAEKLYEVTGLLDCTFAEFYFAHSDWTEYVLQAAKLHDSEVFGRVERALMHHAIYGPKRTIAYHRGERSSLFFRGGKKAFDAADKTSLVASFYEKIMRHGQDLIAEEMRKDAEEEIFWRG